MKYASTVTIIIHVAFVMVVYSMSLSVLAVGNDAYFRLNIKQFIEHFMPLPLAT